MASTLAITTSLVALLLLLHATQACDITVPIQWHQNGKVISGVMKSTDSQTFKIQRFELSFAGPGGTTVTQVVLRLFNRPVTEGGATTTRSTEVQFGSNCGECTQKIIDETWPTFPCNSPGSFSFGSPSVLISWDQIPTQASHTTESLLADWNASKCPLSCSREADIVFLVDASGSIDCPSGFCSGDTSNGPNWKRIVSFLNNVTSRFTVGPQATRFGIVYFAGRSDSSDNDLFCLPGNANEYKSSTPDKSTTYIYRYYPDIGHRNGFPDYNMKQSSAYKCWNNDVQNKQKGGYASIELALSGNSTLVGSVTNSLTNARISTYDYTAMGTGVQLVSRVFSKDPARRNVSKILITLTDGNNNRGISPDTAVQRLFSEVSGISALVIGVGSDINDDTLLTMTNNVPRNVFRISDFTQFESIINSLVGLSCLSSSGTSDSCGGQCDSFCSPCGCQCMCSFCETCAGNGVCVDDSDKCGVCHLCSDEGCIMEDDDVVCEGECAVCQGGQCSDDSRECVGGHCVPLANGTTCGLGGCQTCLSGQCVDTSALCPECQQCQLGQCVANLGLNGAMCGGRSCAACSSGLCDFAPCTPSPTSSPSSSPSPSASPSSSPSPFSSASPSITPSPSPLPSLSNSPSSSPSPSESPSASPSSSPSSSSSASPSSSPSLSASPSLPPSLSPSPSSSPSSNFTIPPPKDSDNTAALAGGIAGGAAGLVALTALAGGLLVAGGYALKRALFRTEPPSALAAETTVAPETVVSSNPLAQFSQPSGVNPAYMAPV